MNSVNIRLDILLQIGILDNFDFVLSLLVGIRDDLVFACLEHNLWLEYWTTFSKEVVQYSNPKFNSKLKQIRFFASIRFNFIARYLHENDDSFLSKKIVNL